MDELVSVVIPVYNMADSLEKCIQSIINQTHKKLEIILVDDGSQDASLDVCKKLAAFDNRIKYYHTENQGSGPARNVGIDHAQGRYIYFPDADDFIETNAIELLVHNMADGLYDLIVFGFRIETRSGKLLLEKKYEEEIKKGEELRNSYSDCVHYIDKHAIQGAPWNKFFDLEIIRNNGVYFPSLRRHQDEGFISRYMCFTKNVHFISDVLYTYYENNLDAQWKKFPPNYIDSVIGLYKIRQETILTWNVNDTETHQLINSEYLAKIVKALEISYSPKADFNKKERLDYFKEISEKSELEVHYKEPFNLPIYQRKVCTAMADKEYGKASKIVKAKLFLEGIGVAKIKRKILHK